MFNKTIIFYSISIFVIYFYFGILQEKITKSKYQNEQNTEKFTYMVALCAIQFLVNYLFSLIMLYFWPQPEDKTRKLYYVSCSLTYLLAMISSNMALRWVSYPTQVVGKSAKPIPVMVLGVLAGNKSYPVKKYLFVFMIVVGVALFIYKDKKISSDTSKESSFGIGEILLLLSLTMDGLTGAVQDRMKAETAPSAQYLMKNMNFWSIIYSVVLLMFSGEGVTFVSFVSRHPSVIFDMTMLALCGALGQLFILLMVSNHGPLSCSIVTTTRKFFTVLGSIFIFGNSLILRQWLAAIIVFTGLFLDTLYGKTPSSNLKKDKILQ